MGRLDLVENRLVGIKSRGVYETPAGTVLYMAHREIERLVLDRNTLHYKQTVSVRYAQLIYDGLWFSTLRQALDAFVDFTEQEVTGEVMVRLYKGRAEAIGRRSPRSLYRQDLATFGEGMAYDHKDAEGFIRLFGLPERVRALTRESRGRGGGGGGEGEGDHRGAPLSEGAESGAITWPLGFRAAAVASGIKPDRARPRADRGRPRVPGGGRVHHQQRGGRAGGGEPRAPRLRTRPRDGRERGLRERGHRRARPARRARHGRRRRRRAGLPRGRGGGRLHRRHRGGPAHGQGPRRHRRRRGSLSRDAGADVARAILTTDTHPKEVRVELELGGRRARVGGIVKGAGMIAPRMATLLAFFTTDAAVAPAVLQSALGPRSASR